MKLELTEEQVAVLRGLLVQLMANQVNTNAQSIVNNSQNCIYFLNLLEKPPVVEVKE